MIDFDFVAETENVMSSDENDWFVSYEVLSAKNNNQSKSWFFVGGVFQTPTVGKKNENS